MTDTPYFFGYGSLVNRATHDYPGAQRATLKGWRRRWVRTARRDVVYLSVTPCPATQIDGLIAQVPNADWSALDLRETGYQRHASGTAVQHGLSTTPPIAHYAIAPDLERPGDTHRILLSYLDTVVQGFLREFGQQGVAHFFDTTSGWDTPIHDDRANPIYPRHQPLSAAEKALTDAHLSRIRAKTP